MQELGEALYPIWILLFFALFVGIVAWAYWPSRRRKRQLEDHANIPFRDEENDPSPRDRGK